MSDNDDGATGRPDGVGERWTVTDVSSLEWAMGRWVAATAERARIAAQAAVWRDEARAAYDARVAQVDAWETAEGADADRATAFFGAHMERFARDNRTDDRKSWRVPSGTVRTRVTPAAVTVRERDTLVAWAASDAPGLLEHPPATVPHARLAAAVELVAVPDDDGVVARWEARVDGRPVPGVEVVPPAVSVSFVAVTPPA